MKLSKLILYTLFGVTLVTALRYINVYETGEINISSATYVINILSYTSIAIFIYIGNKSGLSNTPRIIQILFATWLIWISFNLIRGAFLSKDYWDIKFVLLDALPFSLISLTFFLGKNLEIVKNIFLFTIKYLFSYGFIIIPLMLYTNPELYSRLMLPISLFITFIPFVKFRWKILLIIVALTSVLFVVDFRSNIIKIAFSVSLLILYYFRNFISLRWIQLLHFSLFFIPLIFFYLAVADKYNIFEDVSNEENLTTINSSSGEEESMTYDSRTFLYVEVLSSLKSSGNILIGEGSSGKYKSDYFDYLGDGRGRYGSEVGILNILLYNGIIGVAIYFLLLFSVSHFAINNSNNILAKLLGLYIAFRWTYSFVEEFTDYDINFYFVWLAIGLISTSQFRKMNDNEIIIFLKLQ